MQKIKRKSGITLVALIITIIILLILAGVSLSFVFNGGILDKSQQAVNEYENASQKEQDLLDKIDQYLENELGEIANDEPKVPSVDEDGLATEDTTIVAKDDPSIQIVIPEGFAPAILQTGTTQSLPGENGAVKEIMPAEQWNDITKEDINKGIVVVDNEITYDGGQQTGSVSDFNEYVWIPMPDMSKFTRVAWITSFGYDESGKLNQEEQLKQQLSENITEYKFWEDKNTEEYTNMVNSVRDNKGFFVSRYEASQGTNNIPESKRNQVAWSGMNQSASVEASKKVNTDLNSHLIYGVEWDSILNWLIGNAIVGSSEEGKTKIMTIEDIQTDSSNWGNYKNSVGDAKNGSYSCQNTGFSEYWKANNLYDIAGNLYEWNQEIYSTGTNRTNRGRSLS